MVQANAANVQRAERVLSKANCLASDNEGDIVRVTADRVGGFLQVTRANPSGAGTMPAVGVILKKRAATECFVQLHGPLKTSYTGLSPGEVYYVGTDGRPARDGDGNYPSSGGTNVFQQIGVAVASDQLFLHLMSPSFGSAGSDGRYYTQSLTGAIDSANTTFSTSIPFVHGGPSTEKVYFNGILLSEGPSSDYEAVESGGVGTGYDTIEMAFAPIGGDQLSIDFVPDL
jgi:hypothetical protein